MLGRGIPGTVHPEWLTMIGAVGKRTKERRVDDSNLAYATLLSYRNPSSTTTEIVECHTGVCRVAKSRVTVNLLLKNGALVGRGARGISTFLFIMKKYICLFGWSWIRLFHFFKNLHFFGFVGPTLQHDILICKYFVNVLNCDFGGRVQIFLRI